MNADVLQKFRNDGIKEQDYLPFRLALAVELVGNSCRRSLGGRPRSMEHAQCLRIDNTQDHLPECVPFKRDNFVCAKVREKKKLTRQQYRHESCVICTTCDVPCVLLKIGTDTKYITLKLITANFICRTTLNQFISS